MKRKVKNAGPATRRELTNGIGYRIAFVPSEVWRPDPWSHRALEARQGAAAMRHVAFERRTFAPDWIATQIHPAMVQAIGQTPVVAGDPRYVAAWPDELDLGCPAWPAR